MYFCRDFSRCLLPNKRWGCYSHRAQRGYYALCAMRVAPDGLASAVTWLPAGLLTPHFRKCPQHIWFNQKKVLQAQRTTNGVDSVSNKDNEHSRFVMIEFYNVNPQYCLCIVCICPQTKFWAHLSCSCQYINYSIRYKFLRLLDNALKERWWRWLTTRYPRGLS